MRKIILILSFALCLGLSGCQKSDTIEVTKSFVEPEIVDTRIELVADYRAVLDETTTVVNKETAALIPTLSLFSNGTFGFSYDVISSYYSHGTYEEQDGKYYMITDDGERMYVFQIVEEGIRFLKDESSDVSLTDARYGVQIGNGTLFRNTKAKSDNDYIENIESTDDNLANVELEGLEVITGIVKEKKGNVLLFSSKSDTYTGVYEITYDKADLIAEGEEVLIYWDGSVMETYPGQFTAVYIEEVK